MNLARPFKARFGMPPKYSVKSATVEKNFSKPGMLPYFFRGAEE
jgi:hypothetical protein